MGDFSSWEAAADLRRSLGVDAGDDDGHPLPGWLRTIRDNEQLRNPFADEDTDGPTDDERDDRTAMLVTVAACGVADSKTSQLDMKRPSLPLDLKAEPEAGSLADKITWWRRMERVDVAGICPDSTDDTDSNKDSFLSMNMGMVEDLEDAECADPEDPATNPTGEKPAGASREGLKSSKDAVSPPAS